MIRSTNLFRTFNSFEPDDFGGGQSNKRRVPFWLWDFSDGRWTTTPFLPSKNKSDISRRARLVARKSGGKKATKIPVEIIIFGRKIDRLYLSNQKENGYFLRVCSSRLERHTSLNYLAPKKKPIVVTEFQRPEKRQKFPPPKLSGQRLAE